MQARKSIITKNILILLACRKPQSLRASPSHKFLCELPFRKLILCSQSPKASALSSSANRPISQTFGIEFAPMGESVPLRNSPPDLLFLRFTDLFFVQWLASQTHLPPTPAPSPKGRGYSYSRI
jgi:hypothetical protein